MPQKGKVSQIFCKRGNITKLRRQKFFIYLLCVNLSARKSHIINLIVQIVFKPKVYVHEKQKKCILKGGWLQW